MLIRSPSQTEHHHVHRKYRYFNALPNSHLPAAWDKTTKSYLLAANLGVTRYAPAAFCRSLSHLTAAVIDDVARVTATIWLIAPSLGRPAPPTRPAANHSAAIAR